MLWTSILECFVGCRAQCRALTDCDSLLATVAIVAGKGNVKVKEGVKWKRALREGVSSLKHWLCNQTKTCDLTKG
eukprot:4716110-Amphidinium_carterae.1